MLVPRSPDISPLSIFIRISHPRSVRVYTFVLSIHVTALCATRANVVVDSRFLRSRVVLSFQGEKIQTILKAASVDVDPYWPGLFAKALEGINIKDLITNVGSGVGAAPAAGGAAAPAAAAGGAAKEDKKEEKKKVESDPETDDDMGFGMFRSCTFVILVPHLIKPTAFDVSCQKWCAKGGYSTSDKCMLVGSVSLDKGKSGTV